MPYATPSERWTTKPILAASSSVVSRPIQPASFLPANTGAPPGATSCSRRLDVSLWRSRYHPVARSIAQLAPYPIAAPMLMPHPTRHYFAFSYLVLLSILGSDRETNALA